MLERSEDRRDTPRACVRAPGPRRNHLPRPDAPKDDETKEASASRPCGPSCSLAHLTPDDPEGPPDKLAARVSALGAHQHRPFTAQRTSEEARRAVKGQLRAPLGTRSLRRYTFGQLRRASRRRKPSLPRTRCSPPTNRTRPPDPEGTGAGPSDHAGRDEDAVPNERATLRLRRARQQGAERSERSRLSPSPTPGRIPGPEGPRLRQGCRFRTRGVLP